jgi:uncharacterized cofD-like protein
MKVVGIGGGHGLAATLQAALMYADDVAAVVTVADDGGSSGRLTTELGIPPPGDIRNCLVALADGGPLAEMFQHRFGTGTLEGHPIGNLVIAALAEMRGDFAAAVEETGRLLGSRGRVYPATTELVKLSALVEGGVVQGQVAVAQTTEPIHSVHLVPPDPRAHPQAVEAILDADQVVIGPGSLFTSLIATLLVPGIREALAETSAQRVFVCNARIQKGETEGMDAAQHVEALLVHAGSSSVDVVLLQSPGPPDGVRLGDEPWAWPEIKVEEADVWRRDGGHNPELLAKALASLA